MPPRPLSTTKLLDAYRAADERAAGEYRLARDCRCPPARANRYRADAFRTFFRHYTA